MLKENSSKQKWSKEFGKSLSRQNSQGSPTRISLKNTRDPSRSWQSGITAWSSVIRSLKYVSRSRVSETPTTSSTWNNQNLPLNRSNKTHYCSNNARKVAMRKRQQSCQSRSVIEKNSKTVKNPKKSKKGPLLRCHSRKSWNPTIQVILSQIKSKI